MTANDQIRQADSIGDAALRQRSQNLRQAALTAVEMRQDAQAAVLKRCLDPECSLQRHIRHGHA